MNNCPNLLYIHIPYCIGKCAYCNFYSKENPDWESYLQAVENELFLRRNEFTDNSLLSIYIGGGTPSLIPGVFFIRFINNIKQILLEFGIILNRDVEFTIEVNPEDITIEKIHAWKEVGVNRISMGIQSFNDDELKLINRRHNAEKAINSLSKLKDNFNNISCDLIYGIPGQTVISLENSLNKLLYFKPNHVSVYALTYEKNTPLYKKLLDNRISANTDEEYIKLGTVADEILMNHGYERYEISNYSKPGFRSRHNSAYWSGNPYLGLGPSASSFNGTNVRKTNHSNLKLYIETFKEKGNIKQAFYVQETLTNEELVEETIMLKLRTREGISLPAYERQFGLHEKESLMIKASRWINSGDLSFDGFKLAFTKKGINISDYVILNLI